MYKLGVQSEVGKLNAVMVCRPGLAHQRLTPANCHALLFDDVLWVHEAQKDHFDFVLKMQERGVEVLDLQDLLAQVLELAEARAMGPKVDAACRFAEATGKVAAIGALADIPAIVEGRKGTLVGSAHGGVSWHR